ncbi:hypothetical protein [Bacillus cihuensis]|uniref:hypothetical protein n=1 Tax=Bacillus cihuensis TaxID=1208599 RepID=UPI00048CB20F|nr:hypothetical protein [Bacillus cihuensis]
MKKKWLFILPFVFVLLFIPVASALAYYTTFVYDFDTTLRSKDRTIKTNDDVVFKFNSVKCRKGHYMTVLVKHNVTRGFDTLLEKKKIKECGGTVTLYGHNKSIPVYFIISKPHDGYWVRGTGTITTKKR